MYECSAQILEERIRSPGLGVTGSCKLPDLGTGFSVRATHTLCTVNLTQPRVICEEGTSTKESPISEWPVRKTVSHIPH